MRSYIQPALLATSALAVALPAPALAQESDPAPAATATATATESGGAPAPDGTEQTGTEGATVFVPADFARFAPRNAADMVRNIPGFTFSGFGGGERGLGQASANVLVNGERLSSKSDGVFEQLQRIPAADVVRIEIVDGATLDVPGLSGQVANVVTRGGSDISGQFTWRTQFRPNYAYPNWFGGNISVNGRTGNLAFTVALSNPNGRSASGGPTLVYDGDGDLIEARDTVFRSRSDNPKLATSLKWDAPGSALVNFNASYQRSFFNLEDDEDRRPAGGDLVVRDLRSRERGYNYELGGDVEFDLGPGKLKLIGLERFSENRFRQSAIFTVPAQDDVFGFGYRQTGQSRETIGRGEYSWKMWGGDWQVAGEAAFNSYDNVAQLGDYDPTDGSIDFADFEGGSGGVKEDRYEASISHSRSLASNLSMQLVLGGEFSRLSQTGPNGLVREFWRPKGQFSLAWKPQQGLDVSLRLQRRVGQLSFGDFLASVDLDDGNDNAGNNSLVPPQTWEARLQVSKDLGKWGSTTLTGIYWQVDDRLEIIPLPGGLETRGNIDKATLWEISTSTTINLDPLGLKGGRLEFSGGIEETNLKDPLTGLDRPWSFFRDRYFEVEFRHDIPGSDIAYELGVEYNHNLPYYRLSEVGREYEGPFYTYVSVEHKDVFGLTVSASVFNLLDGRRVAERTVFDGPRNTSPVLFREETDQLIGPIFSFSVQGTF